MTNFTKLAVIAAGVLSIAGSAGANTIVAEADVNEDGMYSWEEMASVYADLTEDTFIVIDTSNDGLVDEAEMTAAVEAGLLPVTDG